MYIRQLSSYHSYSQLRNVSCERILHRRRQANRVGLRTRAPAFCRTWVQIMVVRGAVAEEFLDPVNVLADPRPSGDEGRAEEDGAAGECRSAVAPGIGRQLLYVTCVH